MKSLGTISRTFKGYFITDFFREMRQKYLRPFAIHLIHWPPPSNIYHCQRRRRGEKSLSFLDKDKLVFFSEDYLIFAPTVKQLEFLCFVYIEFAFS